MMGLSINEFRNSSPIEIYMAIDGFSEFNGSDQKEKPLDRNELDKLMELYPD